LQLVGVEMRNVTAAGFSAITGWGNCWNSGKCTWYGDVKVLVLTICFLFQGLEFSKWPLYKKDLLFSQWHWQGRKKRSQNNDS